MASSMLFPSVGLQVLSSLIHLLGLTVLTHCISRRVQHESLTWHGLSTMPWPRLSVIMMFCMSWLFLFSSGILLMGVGLELNVAVCTAAIYLCIIFYSSSKFLVYAFLAEKVHVVWSPTVGTRRFESPVYLTCIVSVALYCIVITLMVGGPIHEFNSDGACVIGLKPLASIPLLVYDLYINIFLTGMFMWPLVRSKIMSGGVRRLAIRTFVAALFGLTTSTVNMTVLIILHGRELGWVNLGACGGDIIVNATAIFWVSGSSYGMRRPDVTTSGLPERARRNTFTHNRTTDSIQSPTGQDAQTNTKSSLADQAASFHIYDIESIHENRPLWFRRIFGHDRSFPRDMKVCIFDCCHQLWLFAMF
ncbi:hypothetical protein BDQ17DRAFT_1241723 [Cyathus striatus]|nr:hypothetical protein BDQ17DRAFT_1241723 [Cyathus striatus]